MMKKPPIAVCWFRRDLRLEDNAALFHALTSGLPVLPVFVFDTEILDKLENKADKRVDFIYRALKKLNDELKKHGASFFIFHGKPLDAFQQISRHFEVCKAFANHDYEPYAIKRDAEIERFLNGKNSAFHTFKDQVVFEKSEVTKPDGTPYNVFTPYSKKWKEHCSNDKTPLLESEKHLDNLYKNKSFSFPALAEIGFKKTTLKVPHLQLDRKTLKNYSDTRNFPAQDSTSNASLYLRFGIISVRKLVCWAKKTNEVYLNELIWREFFMMILFHYPKVVDHNFKEKYDRLQWRNNEKEFLLWCRGETGYPLVDAGMRQLNQTGRMHNRVRMVVAGFLTKHLLIDWRWGEAYFAEKLLDYELSSNNGNWQWAAGTGCDAAPYFRVFNPMEQAKKFDPGQKYINTWIDDFRNYPLPIVEHKFARKRALETYKKAMGK